MEKKFGEEALSQKLPPRQKIIAPPLPPPLNSPPSPAATYRPESTPFAQSLRYDPIDHPSHRRCSPASPQPTRYVDLTPPSSTPTRRRPRHHNIIVRMDALQNEEDAAKWRRNNGVERVDGVLRDTRFLPHPSAGGSRGYDIPFRQMIVDAYQAGNPAPEGMRNSVWRWRQNGAFP